MPERIIEFVTYEHALDKHPAQHRFTEEEFFTLFSEHDVTDCDFPCSGKCGNKDGLAWSHGFIPEGKTRTDANVEFFDVIGFDLDHLTRAEFMEMCARLDEERVVIYSTHRHSEDEYRVRLVFFPSRRVKKHEFKLLRHAVVEKFKLKDDKKASNASRIFFMPTAPRGAPTIAVSNLGRYLDVDTLLLEKHQAALQQRLKPAVPEAPEPGSVDMDALRTRLRGYEPEDDPGGEKKALIRRVLKGEPLADKGGRDDAVHRASAIVAYLLPLGTPVEAAMEVLRASVVSMPQYEDDERGEDPEGWLAKARYSFERASERRQEEARENNALLAAIHEMRGKKQPKQDPPAAPPAPPPSPPPGGPPPDDGEQPDEERPDAWRLRLTFKLDRNNIPRFDADGNNVAQVLMHHPEWRGMLRFNEVTKDVECIGGPLTDLEKRNLPVATANWIKREVGIALPTMVIAEQLLYVACQNPYDPLKDYLRSLKWDGVPRLDTWLEAYCGAVVIDEHGQDITTYVRNVAKRWLISAVARALTPGCKADNVIVLEGGQGIGKSTALAILGGEFFADAQLSITDKDSKMLAASNWIVELSELSAMRSNETEAHKAFLSSAIDKFRMPYGRRVETFPRRCVFAGTTNESSYLRDDTGNRRFWPVPCGNFDLVALRRDRDQLWAEAVSRFDSNEAWWFDRVEGAISEHVTTTRLKSDLADLVRIWFVTKDPSVRPESVTTSFVAMTILSLPADRIEPQRQAIGRALKVLHFDRRRVRKDGALLWEYFTPENLKMAPKMERRSFLSYAPAGPTQPEAKA